MQIGWHVVHCSCDHQLQLSSGIGRLSRLLLVLLWFPQKPIEGLLGIVLNNEPLCIWARFLRFGFFHCDIMIHEKGVPRRGVGPLRLKATRVQAGPVFHFSTGAQSECGAGGRFSHCNPLSLGPGLSAALNPSSLILLLRLIGTHLDVGFKDAQHRLKHSAIRLRNIFWILDEGFIKSRDWQTGKSFRGNIALTCRIRWIWGWCMSRRSSACGSSSRSCPWAPTAHSLKVRRYGVSRFLHGFQVEPDSLFKHLPLCHSSGAKAFLDFGSCRGRDVGVSDDWRVARFNNLAKGGPPFFGSRFSRFHEFPKGRSRLAIIPDQVKEAETRKKRRLIASRQVRQHAPINMIRQGGLLDLLYESFKYAICGIRRQIPILVSGHWVYLQTISVLRKLHPEDSINQGRVYVN